MQLSKKLSVFRISTDFWENLFLFFLSIRINHQTSLIFFNLQFSEFFLDCTIFLVWLMIKEAGKWIVFDFGGIFTYILYPHHRHCFELIHQWNRVCENFIKITWTHSFFELLWWFMKLEKLDDSGKSSENLKFEGF